MARRLRVAMVIVTVLLGVLALQRLAGLDARFLALSSLSGVEGLVAYLLGDYARAAKAYRQHLATTTEDHEGPLGTRSLLVGDLDAARREALDALRAGRAERHARLTLGEVALARGQHREAVAELDALLATDADQFDAQLLKAVAQARLGLDGDAIASLNRALRHSRVETRPTAFLSALALVGELGSRPSKQRSLCLLATLHRYLRIYDPARAGTAVRYAEQAVAAGDYPADAYFTVGMVQLRRGRRARAQAAFRAAIEAEPRHALALVYAAQLHGERGDMPEEDRLMTTAFEAVPDDDWVVLRFNVHLTRLGDYQRAIDLNVRRTATAAADGQAWGRLGVLYHDLGEFEQALAATEKALALHPREPTVRLARASALSAMRRFDDAIAEYQRMLALDPADGRAHAGIALIHKEAKRYAEARREFEAALSLGVTDPNFHAGYCELLILLREGAAAERCAARILRYDPDNVAAKQNLGVARRMQGATR